MKPYMIMDKLLRLYCLIQQDTTVSVSSLQCSYSILQENSLLSKWKKWIHEETSDMAVLLTLFGSYAEVVRLQSVNAALTRFQHVTDS